MKIYIDSRETGLYEKCVLSNDGNGTFVEVEQKPLPLGDAIIESDEGRPVWLIERKSLFDLLASIKDGRYVEQSFRLENSAEFPRHNVVYIIEGMYSQLASFQQKKVILSTIASLSLFKGFSVFRTCNLQETAELLVWVADKIDRKFQKGTMPHDCRWNVQSLPMPVQSLPMPVQSLPMPEEHYSTVVKKVKKENVTEDNIAVIMLCSIPGISSATAISLMREHEGSLKRFIQTLENDPSIVENTMIGEGEKKRKISKNMVATLKQYLLR
uniref:ERCC4 domain-containing protein n=1 Tax=viral metagenome TaxID=1070528 RepID=A0A6C0HJS9_9ZZZZ